MFSLVVDEFTRCMSSSPGGPDKSRFIFYISVLLGCKEKKSRIRETLNLLTNADKIVPFSTSLVRENLCYWVVVSLGVVGMGL